MNDLQPLLYAMEPKSRPASLFSHFQLPKVNTLFAIFGMTCTYVYTVHIYMIGQNKSRFEQFESQMTQIIFSLPVFQLLELILNPDVKVISVEILVKLKYRLATRRCVEKVQDTAGLQVPRSSPSVFISFPNISPSDTHIYPGRC